MGIGCVYGTVQLSNKFYSRMTIHFGKYVIVLEYCSQQMWALPVEFPYFAIPIVAGLQQKKHLNTDQYSCRTSNIGSSNTPMASWQTKIYRPKHRRIFRHFNDIVFSKIFAKSYGLLHGIIHVAGVPTVNGFTAVAVTLAGASILLLSTHLMLMILVLWLTSLL
jgi:hypothetical protein